MQLAPNQAHYYNSKFVYFDIFKNQNNSLSMSTLF